MAEENDAEDGEDEKSSGEEDGDPMSVRRHSARIKAMGAVKCVEDEKEEQGNSSGGGVSRKRKAVEPLNTHTSSQNS